MASLSPFNTAASPLHRGLVPPAGTGAPSSTPKEAVNYVGVVTQLWPTWDGSVTSPFFATPHTPPHPLRVARGTGTGCLLVPVKQEMKQRPSGLP